MGDLRLSNSVCDYQQLHSTARIVSLCETTGRLKLEVDNLRHLLPEVIHLAKSSTQSEETRDSISDAPLKIVCVMGGEKCGKSILTNLLIQHQQCQGQGGWLGSFVEKVNGSSSTDQGYFRRELGKETVSGCYREEGVYLWPELFLQTGTGFNEDYVQAIVLVLYTIHSLGSPEDRLRLMEQAMVLVSSRIIEIVMENSNQVKRYP